MRGVLPPLPIHLHDVVLERTDNLWPLIFTVLLTFTRKYLTYEWCCIAGARVKE